MATNALDLEHAAHVLAELADPADEQAVWPAQSWEVAQLAGAMGWAIPTEYGGLGLPPPELYESYRRLASGCLTTCFILSQRDAAARRIRDFGSEDLRRELLRPLACGGRFMTVGLSQLTTSRQHGRPALAATLTETELTLHGVIPWVTGAAEAAHLIIGATQDDGRQVLAVLPADTPGVTVGPPLALMALTGSLTAEVCCSHVRLDRRWLLAGPAEKVMAGGRGAGGLETSSLALGLASAAVEYLAAEGQRRLNLAPLADRLGRTHQTLRTELHHLAEKGGTPETATALRARANTLALRTTQAALMASKGTGYVRPHPAQRWVRQAMFFLVWSCPQPAVEATLAELVPADVCGLE